MRSSALSAGVPTGCLQIPRKGRHGHLGVTHTPYLIGTHPLPGARMKYYSVMCPVGVK